MVSSILTPKYLSPKLSERPLPLFWALSNHWIRQLFAFSVMIFRQFVKTILALDAIVTRSRFLPLKAPLLWPSPSRTWPPDSPIPPWMTVSPHWTIEGISSGIFLLQLSINEISRIVEVNLFSFSKFSLYVF